MPRDGVARLRETVMGTFVPVIEPAQERWEVGALRLRDDGQVELSIPLESTPEGRMPRHEGHTYPPIAGMTEVGDVLVAPIRSWVQPTFAQGRRTQVRRLTSGFALVGVDVEDVQDDLVHSLELDYLGLTGWSTRLRDEPIFADGRMTGWTLEFPEHEPKKAALAEGAEVHLRCVWSVDGEVDQKFILAPLSVGVTYPDRVSIDRVLSDLDAVHALLVLAHRNEVKATRGRGKLTPDSEWAALWEANMMSLSGEGIRNEFAVFRLEHIGGIGGIAAWVKLCRDHRRAVAPLVSMRLLANQTPESRLLSTSAALAYWTAANKKSLGLRKGDKEHQRLLALMGRVDSAWESWVGEPEAWADEFWKAYNDLKHDPAAQMDPHRISLLEYGGRWLLTGALLDACAGSTGPSREIFSHGLLLGEPSLAEQLFGD